MVFNVQYLNSSNISERFGVSLRVLFIVIYTYEEILTNDRMCIYVIFSNR